MSMHDPKHPIWGLARTALVMIAVSLAFIFGHNRFDGDEIRDLIVLLGASVAGNRFIHPPES